VKGQAASPTTPAPHHLEKKESTGEKEAPEQAKQSTQAQPKHATESKARGDTKHDCLKPDASQRSGS
jgi:hypothetical protein